MRFHLDWAILLTVYLCPKESNALQSSLGRCNGHSPAAAAAAAATAAATAARRTKADCCPRQQPAGPRRLTTKSYQQLRDDESESTHKQQKQRQKTPVIGRDPLMNLNMKLDALARAEAPEHARMLYQRIAALYEEGYYPTRPDLVSFNTVLKAYKDDPEGALEFWEKEAHQIVPSVRSYNAFLLALAKTGLAEQAETLLRHMQAINSNAQPDLISYNTVLLAFRNSPHSNAAEKAQSLLQEMIGSESVSPDAISFNTVAAAWASRNDKASTRMAQECLDMMHDHGLELDVYSYTTLIQAMTRFRGSSGRSLEQLRAMQQHHGHQPNKIAYTAVLHAFCQDQKPHDAMKLLNEMWEQNDPEVLPDVVTYSAMIDGWAVMADTQPQQSVDAVMQLLDQMCRQGVYANEQTFTSVLSTIARASQYDAGTRAWSVIDQMRDSGISVSVIHYNAVLDAFSRSPNANKVVEARRVWQEMLDCGLEPDVISYNSLLSVGANAFGRLEIRQQGLQLALEAYRALQSDPDCEATSITYTSLFKSIRKFMPSSDQRTRAIQHAFRLCCQQGCLNAHVLLYLQQQTCSEPEFRELLGGAYKADVAIDDLPLEWSQNALAVRPKALSSTLTSRVRT